MRIEDCEDDLAWDDGLWIDHLLIANFSEFFDE